MSSTYAGNSASYPANITIPSDGDAFDASAFNPAYEGLADRASFLKAAIATPLADLTALAAIAAPSDGLVRHVVGHGLYVFKTSATTGLTPFRVAAADATPGGWVSSTAHETSVTKWVAAALTSGVSGNSGGPVAEPPSTDPTGFIGLSTGGRVRAGFLRVSLASLSGTDAYGFQIPLDAFLVDGATLDTATLYFRPTAHGADPAERPRFGIIRSPKAGPYTVVPTALLSSGGGLVQDAGGTYVSDRTLVFTPDQNNVIDLDAYTYTALIWDEHSTNAVLGNGYAGVELAMSGVPDARR